MKIVFHFGPPKTGTSAIQKWLSSNSEWLISQGVYYPQHSLDPNGVSSGNLRSVFSGDKGNFEFSLALYQQEVEKAQRKKCHTLLFSSEFFFRNIELISQNVPEALFVGYIRFGLDTLQSSYNQAVKRHARTTIFAPGNHIQSTLTALSRKIDQVGEKRFLLRPYHNALFSKNSLVPDFLETIGVDTSEIDTSVGRVNPSYSIEAIEVKRWFNQLHSESLQTRLDLALQGYGNGEPFSLLNDQDFEAAKKRYLIQLSRFIDKHQVHQGAEFVALCEALENQPYQAQELSNTQFQKVLKDVVASKKLTHAALYTAYTLARDQQNNLTNPERIAILNKVVPGWVKLVAKCKAALAYRSQEVDQ